MQHPPGYQEFKTSHVHEHRQQKDGGGGGHSRKIALVSMKDRKFRLAIGVS